MSSRPSAFEVLMSGARIAAAAKKKLQPSSSKKRKTLDPTNPIEKPQLLSTPESAGTTQDPESVELKAPESKEIKEAQENSSCGSNEVVPAGKKVCVAAGAEEWTEELKSRMPPLKKKAREFDPKLVANWGQGERIPFVFVCLVFDLIDKETGRIVITDIVCNMLRTVMYTTPEDLVPMIYLAANRIAPAHEGLELGIGDASIIKALAEACGRTEAHTETILRKPDALTVTKVFSTFCRLAMSCFMNLGRIVRRSKKNHIKALLVAATDCEPLYPIRLLQPTLRFKCFVLYTEKISAPPPHIQNYDKIVPALLSGSVWNLPEICNFTLGVPVGPMLAKPTKGVSEIIHFMENGLVEIYSRNAERNTGKYPDVVVAVSRLKKSYVTSFVLDCKIVAYDCEKQKILPFQVLSTRPRKNVSVRDIKVEVCIFSFDMLHLNGRPLIQEQLKVRRECLYDSSVEEAGFFQFATALTSNDIDEIQKFLDAAVSSSSEGLIIKTLSKDATYEPSKRSLNWLKLKKDYMDSMGDSLDLVTIAAFHGQGKCIWFFGFLLSVYDFYSYYRYSDSLNPDVWFDPSEVHWIIFYFTCQYLLLLCEM
ncbi:DNA ligase 1 [Pyrus ussuriensis x Pyrus communis]|uniref:DNA ligase 1 n=1 Tax=Pyrus ussuriensis x Pyrus communis TaxID=2448454 RepID=A0A5N5FZ05_9ROSA|nr:DNA ligase 1 [Pyrus ussuriensis x Pyrus communis]